MTRISRRGAVEPFHVMELLKAANQRNAERGDVVFLCVGQPSTPAPVPARAAAAAAIQSGELLGYTDALGNSELRHTIARHYAASYGVPVEPDQVVVTTGSSGAFTLIFLAAFEAGDTVVMTRPGYPAYRNSLKALGCHVVELDCGPDTRYQVTAAMLDELSEPPAGLIIASPANPTGTIIEPDVLAAIVRWCEAHGTLLISDEIYHGISYGEPAVTAWQTSQRYVVVGSLSKFYSMTGWRVGWMLVPPQLVRPMELLQGNLNICAPAISQVAAIGAFSSEATAELEGHVARYAANRELLLGLLPQLGISEIASPDGAFYAYADVSHLTDDSQRWCFEVLDRTGVALTPGIDFAPDPGDGRKFVRLSFAGTAAEITEAFERFARLL